MPELLTMGCMLACTFGMAHMPFVALELPGKPTVDGLPTASVADIMPLDNIPSFIMCKSPANPEVAAATAAALGVLTPMPCIPEIVAPWDPPSGVLVFGAMPLATIASKCMCAWGGSISVEVPSEFTVADDT
jgi:Domain of unknown function (DUF4280)